ncbi:hypothetical protein APHAL10511_003333 [Amanita phalloides]|nr:hypothetical protein APHAL10511_003333 [Amanita phalloides]
MASSTSRPPRATVFSLSLPSSAASSRNSSPTPPARRKNASRDSRLDITSEESPGSLTVNVYDTMLPRWRAAIRRRLLARVESESKVIARMQEFIRTPFLDAYFVYTSSLGTHTFFMAAIPALYFFGYDDLGGGLILILAFGVYLTSVIKDLACSPRPFAPPVTRLTISTHHLEYGFPSTHCTNSISIALFLFALIHRLAYPSQLIAAEIPIEPAMSPQTFTFLCILLCIYTFSIVYGRLYTAMHSFTDCAAGVFIGAVIWWAETSWTGIPIRLLSSSYSILINALTFLGVGTPISSASTSTSPDLVVHLGHGLGLGSTVSAWVEKGGWEVPLILIPLAILAANQHPQPVDDCPCFEDAIAFGSVVLGVLVGKWAMNQLGISRVPTIMPGSGWVYAADRGWTQVARTWEDVLAWWGIALLKMVFGLFTIFAWRLLAKSAMHLVLPPVYRLLARAVELPKRRFYTPATDYKSVPSEFSKEGGLLRPIPSVIDLPAQRGVAVVEKRNGNEMRGRKRARDIKLRNGVADREKNAAMKACEADTSDEDKDKDGQPIKHYDADVVTKLVVYSGIAVLASEALPALYNILGWGIRSWPSA